MCSPDHPAGLATGTIGFGVELTYSYEEALLGTAGGVRNVSGYFGDDPSW